VTTGSTSGGFVEIKDGLKLGDRLVADGLNRLQDGQSVALARPGRDSGTASRNLPGGR
jgi:membrane fusion protein (multidrug efflux system)